MSIDRPDPDTFAVCVFTASAEAVTPAYRSLARDLGRGLAGRGWRTVYGGGKVGLMGEVAVAAVEAGGKVTGVIPHSLNQRERAFDDIDDLVMVDTLAERKTIMDLRSDAFVVMPGGIGTLDELLEVMTTRHLGFHQRPLLLLDPDGYWRSFHALLADMVAANLLRPESADIPVTVPTVEALLEMLAAHAG